MIEIAKALALEAHKNQRYGDKAYSVHLEAVVQILNDEGINTAEKIAAAWLHDAIEDTDLTEQTIYEKTGSARVASMVAACTGVGENRKARNASIYEKIALNTEAADVKVADRIANVEASKGTDLAKMYAKERQAFHENVANYASAALVKRLVRAYA